MGSRRTSINRGECCRISVAIDDTAPHSRDCCCAQHQHDLDVSQSANKSALLRLAERLALLHDDHYRLRETIGALASRSDIHDLELRLGERIDSLVAHFNQAFQFPSFVTMSRTNGMHICAARRKQIRTRNEKQLTEAARGRPRQSTLSLGSLQTTRRDACDKWRRPPRLPSGKRNSFPATRNLGQNDISMI